MLSLFHVTNNFDYKIQVTTNNNIMKTKTNTINMRMMTINIKKRIININNHLIKKHHLINHNNNTKLLPRLLIKIHQDLKQSIKMQEKDQFLNLNRITTKRVRLNQSTKHLMMMKMTYLNTRIIKKSLLHRFILLQDKKLQKNSTCLVQEKIQMLMFLQIIQTSVNQIHQERMSLQ